MKKRTLASAPSKNITGPTRRRLAISAAADIVTDELLVQANAYYDSNKLANELAAKAEKARAELYAAMKARGVKTFDFVSGKGAALEAMLTQSERTKINVRKLRAELKNDDALLDIVSATVKDVETHCGKAMVDLCGEIKKGDENVSVKPKK